MGETRIFGYKSRSNYPIKSIIDTTIILDKYDTENPSVYMKIEKNNRKGNSKSKY